MAELSDAAAVLLTMQQLSRSLLSDSESCDSGHWQRRIAAAGHISSVLPQRTAEACMLPQAEQRSSLHHSVDALLADNRWRCVSRLEVASVAQLAHCATASGRGAACCTGAACTTSGLDVHTV